MLHNLIPSLAAALSKSDNPFQCFSEIDKLYNDGFVIKHEEQKKVLESLLLPRILKQVVSAGGRLLRYETPAIISSMHLSSFGHIHIHFLFPYTLSLNWI